MTNYQALTAATLFLVCSVPHVVAVADDQPPHPGVVSIDWGSQLGGSEPKVSVNLNQPLLRFVTSVASEAATEVTGVREMIGQLRLVRVEVYEGVNKGALTTASEAESSKLQNLGWTSVVRAIGDDNESVNVLMLPNGESISGLVVIAAGPGEMAFVNVAGELDPEVLGKHIGALVRLTHNGKVNLKDLINTEAVETLIKEAAQERAHDGAEPTDGH